MKNYDRIFVIVLDSLGIGAMPDSAKFGDIGVDTFGHILEKMGSLEIPNLRKLGMLNLHPAGKMAGVENPKGRYTHLGEASNGKDTMTGHWEMMGIKTEKPFKTFTETGFPPEWIAELEKRCGKRVIGNKSASGTEIIEELGEEEIQTGAMIVYTSADSVLQICGNEETFDLQNLYRCCEIAREITMKDEWRVGRVIARPYIGKKKGEFKRTPLYGNRCILVLFQNFHNTCSLFQTRLCISIQIRTKLCEALQLTVLGINQFQCSCYLLHCLDLRITTNS